MLEKEFVPYEQVIALKELGFNEPCILLYRGLDTQPVCQMGYEFKTEKNSDYNDETNYWLTVPTYSQAFRWFREKYDYNHSIVFTKHPFGTDEYQYMILLEDDEYVEINFKTYEEAELACLEKLIEITKTK